MRRYIYMFLLKRSSNQQSYSITVYHNKVSFESSFYWTNWRFTSTPSTKHQRFLPHRQTIYYQWEFGSWPEFIFPINLLPAETIQATQTNHWKHSVQHTASVQARCSVLCWQSSNKNNWTSRQAADWPEKHKHRIPFNRWHSLMYNIANAHRPLCSVSIITRFHHITSDKQVHIGHRLVESGTVVLKIDNANDRSRNYNSTTQS
jgi:hypothetical protein